MAILPPFRAPQPMAAYVAPWYQTRDGVKIGWAIPLNVGAGFVGAVYWLKHFGLDAFPVAAGNDPATFSEVLPIRWGRLRGVMATLSPPALPPPGPGP